MTSVLIADDHPIVRRGVRDVIRDEFAAFEVEEAATGREVRQLLSRRRFDLLLLDISLPDESGLEILREVARQAGAPRVLVLSVYPEEHFALRALRAGAKGYLTKESVPDQLVTAIRRVLGGRTYISETLAEAAVLTHGRASGGAAHEALSDREFEVLRLIGGGRRNRDVARRLRLSPKTVSTYRARIVEKLGLATDAAIVRYVLEHGLLDDPGPPPPSPRRRK